MKMGIKNSLLISKVFVPVIIIALFLLAFYGCVSSDPAPTAKETSSARGETSQSASSAEEQPLVIKQIVPEKNTTQPAAPAEGKNSDVVSGSSEEGGSNLNSVPLRNTMMTNNYVVESYPDPLPDPTEPPRQVLVTEPPKPAPTEAPAPPSAPVTLTTKPDQTGDVWLEPRTISVAAGEKFETTFRINTGSQKAAAWAFTITFNSNIIAPDKTKGANKIIVAGDATHQPVVNLNREGIITVAGFAVAGVPSNSNYLLYKINWTAVSSGTSRITIDVGSLTDQNYKDIGNSRGFWSLVTVK